MTNKYKEQLLHTASSLDAVAACNGELTKNALAITEVRDNKATKTLCKMLSDIVAIHKQNPRILEIAKLLNHNLIEYYGYTSLQDIVGRNEKDEQETEDGKSLTELLEDLNRLVGLHQVKDTMFAEVFGRRPSMV